MVSRLGAHLHTPSALCLTVTCKVGRDKGCKMDDSIPGGWMVGDRIGSYVITAFDYDSRLFTLRRFKDGMSVTMTCDEVCDIAERATNRRYSSQAARNRRAAQRYGRSGWWGPKRPG